MGVLRAEEEGLGLAPFGMDLQHLHFQAHYALGEWDHAQELADGFPVRVTSQPEAVLSAMALFIDVARGNGAAAERRTWLDPFWADMMVAYIGRGLLAEQALWDGDTALALSHAQAAISADSWPSHSPSVLRVAAVAIAAHADRACALRAGGDLDAAAASAAAAAALVGLAREGASYPARPKAVLGPEGRGCLARCLAEYERASGDNTPAAWQAMLDAFGPGYVYETARAQWRLAEALAEAGRRDDAAAVWRSAKATATRLRAAPLAAALHDLARRARLDVGCQERPSPRRRGDRRADRPRARGAPPAGPRPVQQGDRRGAVHHPEDRQRARIQHPRQARRRQPHGSRRDSPPRRRLTRIPRARPRSLEPHCTHSSCRWSQTPCATARYWRCGPQRQ